MTDYEQAVAYIETSQRKGRQTDLSRMRLLMELLGDPQKKCRYIHIAGSNGKGSAAAMLDSVLRCCGYKTGLYTSPHLIRYNERMKCCGEDISDAEFVIFAKKIRDAEAKMDDKPTVFEKITALAFLFFASRGCEYVVLEVGLGGRLDATNVIDESEVSVIMNLGLEHTHILGDTIEEIAYEKGSIIKDGGVCVCYSSGDAPTAVIGKLCADRNARFVLCDFNLIRTGECGLEGQHISYKQHEDIIIPLAGEHQQKNAAVVMDVCDVLGIPQDKAAEGIAKTSWPCRFEIVRKDPLFIVDGGHNPQCAQAVVKAVAQYFPDQKIRFLSGVMADKDYEQTFLKLLPVAKDFICVTPDSPRALPAVMLSDFLKSRGVFAVSYPSVKDALARVLKDNEPCIAFGSLYVAGEIKKLLAEEK